MRSIGVFGHVGNGNLGDEMLLAATIQNVRRRLPDATITAFTVNPVDTLQRHGVPAVPVRRGAQIRRPSSGNGTAAAGAGESRSAPIRGIKRALQRVPFAWRVARGVARVARALREAPGEMRFLLQSYRRLRGVEVLLVAGSGQINDDWGGAWGFPYTLYKWAALCRLTGTRFVFLSIGATPLHSRLSVALARGALSRASYRSFRDPGSKQLVSAFAPVQHDPVMPDLVFSLEWPPLRDGKPRQRPIVALGPMTLFDAALWPSADEATHKAYVNALGEFALWLTGRGYALRLFTTQDKIDGVTIAELRARLPRDAAVEIQPVPEPQQQLAVVADSIANADFVVATRFHGVLLALTRGKPTLAIAYQQKTTELMDSMGQAEFAIEAQRCRFEDLRRLFEKLEERKDRLGEELRALTAAKRELLDRQYVSVLERSG